MYNAMKIVRELEQLDFELDNNQFTEEEMYYLSEEFETRADSSFGASKFVLLPFHSQYVIKIPFTGRYDEYEEYDEENDCYYPSTYYEEFYGAQTFDTWNYCEAEANNYQRAQQCGMEQFFTETICVGKMQCGLPIYLQKRVVTIAAKKYPNGAKREEHLSLHHSEKLILEHSKHPYLFPTAWAIDFLNYYGYRAYEQLIEFVSDIDIADFHMGNVGYLHCGKPVIFDFSGFDS